MTTEELIEQSRALIADVFDRVDRPALAFSGGKESMVMLRLIREIVPAIPILRFKGFEHPQKHFYGDLIIESYDLDEIPASPVGRGVVGKGDHVEIVEAYKLSESADSMMYFPIEAEPGHIPSANSLCAIEKINEPLSDQPLNIDCVFIGHRADDVDLVHGAIPLVNDTVESGGVLFVYPLRDWTEANIWEATEILNVSQNEARYERQEMDSNPDYFPMCVECLKPTDAESIICPKINAPVYAIGRDLNLEHRREEWRNKFVNLKREQ